MKLLSYFALILFWCIPYIGLTQQENHTARLTITPLDGSVPYTHLDFNNSDERFQFAIVTDRTGGHRPGVFMDGVNKLNLMQPEFVMSVGDLIEGYTEDLVELERQWDEFDAFVNQLEMPFFYVPGNHDITNQVMEDLWKKRLGQTYYHFVYNDVLFLALNSEDQRRGAGRGTISDDQFEFVEKTLEKYPDVTWTLLFLHQPLWHQKNTNRWNEVEGLLADRKHTVFAGHEHRYVKEDRNNGKYFTLATTGGGSSLRGTNFGEFDHMVWVTMTQDGPIIANVLLEGIWDENVVTKEHSEWIRDISRAKPFQIEPVIVESTPFFIGGGKIKITNDRNVPMKVRFEEKSSADISGLLEKNTITVAPNYVEKVKYSLRSRTDKHDKPFELVAFVSFLSDDELLQIEVPFTFKLKPLEKRIMPKSTGKIMIDGNEDDWNDLLLYSFSGEDESKASFGLQYDDDYVYMAMRVYDSFVYSTGNGAAWQQDNVGMGFSAEPYVKSAMNRGRNYYNEILFLLATPEKPDAESVISDPLPDGSKYRCLVKPYGYFAEMAVPVSYIEEKQGKDWWTIRVGASVRDVDQGGQQSYWWLPNWREKDNFIGSGMFWRE